LLANETSPYLLQHAHNPVNWVPWKQEHLDKARKENKLILVSIGYSSCHWCHVMEKESFESPSVAEIMNDHFVCIKVDREERPDIDQVYMEAVQMMSGQGGWPLNCFTTPDGIPIYGGTYFRQDQWIGVLKQLAQLWTDNPEKVIQYGQAVKEGLNKKPVLAATGDSVNFNISILDEGVEKWKGRMDLTHGGPNRAPKFPLPGSYDFLMNYAFYKRESTIQDYVNITLQKMARGGIYDQVGGGFTRYSTDVFWKVPHFEKMLYDNAQLIDLYAQAYGLYDQLEYKKTVEATISWLKREMKDESGGFYSALDADSEGEEGKFYTWNPDSLADQYAKFYETGDKALWEGKLIPVRREDVKLSDQSYQELSELNSSLLKERNKRVRPGTDTKIITSWNAMLAKALATASVILDREDYLNDAEKLVSFLESTCYEPGSGKLYHTFTQGKLGSGSFLEDYAFFIDALLAVYEATGKNKYTELARELCHIALDRFYDSGSGLFNFIDKNEEKLISTPVELSDNVIPATNSVMTSNLYKLSALFSLPYFEKIANRLLSGIKEGILEYSEGHFQWMKTWLNRCIGSPEVVVTGPGADKIAESISRENFPLSLKAFSSKPNRLEIFSGRFKNDENQIHICKNHSCQLPHNTLSEALSEIRKIVEETQKELA